MIHFSQTLVRMAHEYINVASTKRIIRAEPIVPAAREEGPCTRRNKRDKGKRCVIPYLTYPLGLDIRNVLAHLS